MPKLKDVEGFNEIEIDEGFSAHLKRGFYMAKHRIGDLPVEIDVSKATIVINNFISKEHGYTYDGILARKIAKALAAADVLRVGNNNICTCKSPIKLQDGQQAGYEKKYCKKCLKDVKD